MTNLETVEILVKTIRYTPFLVSSGLLILSRAWFGTRSVRVAIFVGVASLLAMSGWLARYFLEQSAPHPYYEVVPSAASVWAVSAPALVLDVTLTLALVAAALGAAHAVREARR